MINPIEHSKTKDGAKKYKIEPYVLAGDVYSANQMEGRGGWSWYTGSSSWFYKVGIENILGLQIKQGYLQVNPCIPKEWKEYEIKYNFKDTKYNIVVKNPNGKSGGVTKMFLNHQEVPDFRVKLVNNQKINEIEVII